MMYAGEEEMSNFVERLATDRKLGQGGKGQTAHMIESKTLKTYFRTITHGVTTGKLNEF